jgi:serine/threonine-protein kinase RIO1
MHHLVNMLAEAGVTRPEHVRAVAQVILMSQMDRSLVEAAEELSNSPDSNIIKIWQQVFGGN